MSDERHPRVEIPALVISRTVSLIDGKDQLSFQTALDQTCDVVDLDELFDRLNAAVDRQRAIVELDQKRQALAIAQSQLKMQARLRVEKEAEYRERNTVGRRQARDLSDQQQKSLENIEQAIAHFSADIPIIEARIADLQRIVAREPPAAPPPLAEAAD